MKLNFVHHLIASAILVCVAFSAAATTPAPTVDTVKGADLANGQSSYLKSFADGVIATFTSTPGHFKKKPQDGVTGVGISGGRTGGEIDIGETLEGSFFSGVKVSTITLGLLLAPMSLNPCRLPLPLELLPALAVATLSSRITPL